MVGNKVASHSILIFILVILLAFILPSGCHAQKYGTGKYYPSSPYYEDTTIKGPILRLGAGYGIPYGYLGLNGEYTIFDYLSATAGMGYSPGGPGWVMGVRVYVNEPSRRFRPRVSALYGTVSVLSKKYGTEEIYENDQGYAYGLGLEWKIGHGKKHSLDFDIIMTDYDVPPGYEKKGPEIKFSLGYGKSF